MLAVTETDLPAAVFVASAGEVFATFDRQDSGNVSFGVRSSDTRFFVKTAGSPSSTLSTRVDLLRNAARLATSLSHPLLPPLRNIIESTTGPLLIYDWVDGELLAVPRPQRHDPASPFMRFRALPAPRLLSALDAILDLHAHLAARSWIASDFYDGSLLYDFDLHSLHVIDLDHYHRGPFRNSSGRMCGSTRFMAPEEFTLGSLIDERTTVFTLGRTILELLPDCPPALRAIATRACSPAPTDRHATVADLVAAWTTACSQASPSMDATSST